MKWSEFLNTYCCKENEITGNRPCDNGAGCDKCHTKTMFELWQQLKDQD